MRGCFKVQQKKLDIMKLNLCCRNVQFIGIEQSVLCIDMSILSNSRADEKTEKEKKRHSESPGKGKHVSPKVMFVHHDDPKVEENLRIRGKMTFAVYLNVVNVSFRWSYCRHRCPVVSYLNPEFTCLKY
jgi:hypothetical protein